MALLSSDLIAAVRKGEVKRVRKGLRKGSTDGHDQDGDTLLHLAVLHRQPECLLELLKQGMPADLPNKEGAAALHLASQLGAKLEIEHLLEHGSNVNRTTPYGATALMTAAAHNKPDALTHLLAGTVRKAERCHPR